MLFAESEFRKSRKTKDGATEGEHEESAQFILERLGQKPKVAISEAPPQCPPTLKYLWELFQELSLGLAANGMTAPIITWSDLRSWRKEMRLQLDPWEKLILVRLGYLRFAIWS